jgi:excisionase family DNA binding protein
MITLDNKTYLTPKEGAALLNISMPTIWRWIESGKIKKLSLSPKKIYLDRAELEGMLK